MLYDHIVAIDNDESFGTGVSIKRDAYAAGGADIFEHDKIRQVASDDGKLTIPLMDRTLAKRIKEVSVNDLEFVLKPWIEPRMISFALERFRLVKNAVENEPQDFGRFVDTWNKDTHDYLMKVGLGRKALDKSSGTNENEKAFNVAKVEDRDEMWSLYEQDTYYSRMMQRMMGHKVRENFSKFVTANYQKAKDMQMIADAHKVKAWTPVNLRGTKKEEN